jgi:hypothetical protein
MEPQRAKLEIRQSSNGGFYWRFQIGANILNLSVNHFHTAGEAEANARRVLGPGWRPDGTRVVIPPERRTRRLRAWPVADSPCPEKEHGPFGYSEGPTIVLGFRRYQPTWWQRLFDWLNNPFED